MIPNVVKGADMGHLVRYLLGPGEANEHSDPHLVAGSATLLELHGTEVLDRVEAPEIAAWLDGPRRLFGTDTTVSRTVRDAETGAEKVIRVEEHVWHCSLAVRADAGMLGEEKWHRVANEFATAMGFDGSDGKAPCRWVAVHHGRSENGNDHVHVVVGMVREDGTKWSPYRDFKNAQKACRELEARYEGLTPVTGPVRGIGERGTKPAEAARAKATGAELTVPQELAVKIRAAAVEATGEAEFVRRLRGAGVIVKPRYAEGSTAEVTGYSVMLPTARTGGKWVPYAGGKLGRDLSLPELRTGWGAAKKETPPEAATEWRAAHAGAPVAEQAGRETRALHPAAPGAAAERLARMNTRLATLASGDQAGWADAARQAAGALAAWSGREPGPAGQMAGAARVMARYAQTRHAGPGQGSAGAAAAAVLRAHGNGGEAAVGRELLRTVALVGRHHRDLGHHHEAAALASGVLMPLRTALGVAAAGLARAGEGAERLVAPERDRDLDDLDDGPGLDGPGRTELGRDRGSRGR